MEKSRDAFRTISEVAGWLDVPTHVLRFWESRFSQIKPVKRAGGRRYYRPSDMSLIGGIKTLLHDQGMTIRGVQKMLREQGIKHVSSFSPPLHPDDTAEADDDMVIEGTAVPLERAERPVSIPAPAARTTHVAEPTPEEETTPAAEETGDEEQPDMFPEEEPDVVEAAPVFAHRVVETPPAPVEPAEPLNKIPETPQVPAQDPLDEDGDNGIEMGIGAQLLRMDRHELATRQEALAEIAARVKDLRERMAE